MLPAPSTPAKRYAYVSSSDVNTYIGTSGALKTDNQQRVLIGEAYAQRITHLNLYGFDGTISTNVFSVSAKAHLLRFVQLCFEQNIRCVVPMGNITNNRLNAIIDFNINVATTSNETIDYVLEDEFWNNGYGDFVRVRDVQAANHAALLASGCRSIPYLGFTKQNGDSYGEDFVITAVTAGVSSMTFTTSVNHNFIAGATCELAGVTGFASNPSGQHVMTAAAANQFTISFAAGGGSYGGGGTVSSVYTGTTELRELQSLFDELHFHCYALIPFWSYVDSRIAELTIPRECAFIISGESTTQIPGQSNNFSGNILVGQTPGGVIAYAPQDLVIAYQYIVVDTSVGTGLGYTPNQTGTPRYANADTTPSIIANTIVVGISLFTLTMMRNRAMKNGIRILVHAGANQTMTSTFGTISINDAFAFDDWLPIGRIINYSWSVFSAPPGATTQVFSNPSGTIVTANATPSDVATDFNFSAPALGNWILRLTVSDGDKTSTSDMNLFIEGSGGMTVTLTELKPITCDGDCDSEVRATITSGGIAPFTFAYSNGTTHSGIVITTDDLTDLCEGVISVTVTDSLGATSSASFNVVPPPPLVITLTPTNPTCPGGSDGEIVATVTGGSPLGYAAMDWTKDGIGFVPADPLNPTGLSLGLYELTVTDNQGCVKVAQVNITEPVAITEIHVITDPSCAGLSDGTITITTAGGTGLHTYQWLNPIGIPVPGGIASKITGVYAGNWTVEVTDANGCTQTFPFTVTDPAVINVDIFAPVVDFCIGGSADFQAEILSGGIAPLTYSWSPTTDLDYPNSDRVVFTPTVAGGYLYTVTVTDANGCVGSAFVSGTVSPAFTTVPIIMASGALTGCIGNSITLTVTNPGDFQSLLWSTGETTTSIVVDYEDIFYVLGFSPDTDGCYTTTTYQVLIQPTTITLNSIVQNRCGGSGTGGAIDVTTSGGCSPYTWVWRDALGNPVGTSEDISGLADGNYTLIATDSNGQTATAVFTIFTTAPSLTLSSVNMTLTTSGSITSNVSGGTPGYTYLWNTGAITPDLTNITTPGYYELTVTDTNGCTVTAGVIMIPADSVLINIFMCCAADLTYDYVYERENGLWEEAKCTILKLRLLHGYISDLCDYRTAIENGYETCITEDEKNKITESAKLICGCCDCEEIYDDTLKD